MGSSGHFKPCGQERLKPPYGQDKLKEMEVITEAKKLEKHTLILTGNEKHYPKKYRITLCARMQNEAFETVACLTEANDMDMRRQGERELRLRSHRAAIRNCRALIHHIELSFELRFIDSGSFAFWAKMANSVRNMAAAWYKSDKNRAERLDEENSPEGKSGSFGGKSC
jgi:hypothetical protein